MTPQPAPTPGFYVERCGNLYVYQPIKPTLPDEDQMAWAEYHHSRYEGGE